MRWLLEEFSAYHDWQTFVPRKFQENLLRSPDHPDSAEVFDHATERMESLPLRKFATIPSWHDNKNEKPHPSLRRFFFSARFLVLAD